MRISVIDTIPAGSAFTQIGRVSATSAWHASGATGDWKNAALNALMQQAEDFEADAIIGVDYAIDGVKPTEVPDVRLERICASGVAVKFKRD